jgi:hypothetical protein
MERNFKHDDSCTKGEVENKFKAKAFVMFLQTKKVIQVFTLKDDPEFFTMNLHILSKV